MLQIFHMMHLDVSSKGDKDAPCKLDGTMTSTAPLKNVCEAYTARDGDEKGWSGASQFPRVCRTYDANNNVTNQCCNTASDVHQPIDVA